MAINLDILLDLEVRRTATMPCNTANGTAHNVIVPSFLPMSQPVVEFDDVCPGR